MRESCLGRGETYSERCWPDTAEFNGLLQNWQAAWSRVLLGFVWSGYDILCAEALSEVECSQADEDLERDITQLLEPRIRRAMTGYEPFYVQHGAYERESRAPAPAQPPQYDIAFILRSSPRVMWPLEAKVLRTDASVGEYVKAVKKNFLTCRYSPFSSEGAMVGYLLKGEANVAFENVSRKGGWILLPERDFSKRDHRTSKHERVVPEGKPYPVGFRCHHMVLRLGLA